MIIILPNSLKPKVEVKAPDIEITPSWLSPLTAMSVRYAIDYHPGQDITAFRIKDAMAAISARSISKHSPKITMRILPNAKPPKSIPYDVKQGVDLWIFHTERMRAQYPSDLKRTAVEPPIDTQFKGKPEHSKDSNHYIWIGEIDGNTERLKKAIEWIDAKEDEYSLMVYGTGKAQNVMPAVKLARAIIHPDRISWMGQPIGIADCNTPICGVLQAAPDPSPLENRFHADGIPLIDDFLTEHTK